MLRPLWRQLLPLAALLLVRAQEEGSSDDDKPKESKGPGQSGALTEKPDGCVTVHLGNLAFETTEAEIEAWAAENCGAVDVVRVLRNKKTQKSTGCGFVRRCGGSVGRCGSHAGGGIDWRARRCLREKI